MKGCGLFGYLQIKRGILDVIKARMFKEGRKEMCDLQMQKSRINDAASSFLAPPAGLEPATYGLTVRRSTN